MGDKFKAGLGYTVGSFLMSRVKDVTLTSKHTSHRLHPQDVGVRVRENAKGLSDSSFSSTTVLLRLLRLCSHMHVYVHTQIQQTSPLRFSKK